MSTNQTIHVQGWLCKGGDNHEKKGRGYMKSALEDGGCKAPDLQAEGVWCGAPSAPQQGHIFTFYIEILQILCIPSANLSSNRSHICCSN